VLKNARVKADEFNEKLHNKVMKVKANRNTVATKSSSSLLPFIEKLPTRLGTAIVLSFFDEKRGAMTLMKHLNKGTAKYLRENEEMLD